MRLSLKKTAHAALNGAAKQKIRATGLRFAMRGKTKYSHLEGNNRSNLQTLGRSLR
jgi:hypothetical protein